MSSFLKSSKLKLTSAPLSDKRIICKCILEHLHIYNKPKTTKEAEENFRLFRNKTHYLDSATVISLNNKIIWRNEQSPKMKMRNFSDEFLKNYIKKVGNQVTLSAGGYSIEKQGAQFFSRIDGDFFTIIGLPIIPLLEKLRKLNADGIIK